MSYEQTLPGSPDSIAGAQAWIKSVATSHHPGLREVAQSVIGDMMAIAIRRTPEGGTIRLKATTSDLGLTVEIHDPGKLPDDGNEWSAVSTVVWSAHTARTADGRMTEVELRAKQVAPA